MVGTAEDGRTSSKSSDRLVSAVVVDFRWSQDKILKLPERWRLCNFGKRCRAKRPEKSTSLSTIDSMLLSRTSSPPEINAEIMVAKSSVSSPVRWTIRMTSRAARSLSASRKALSKSLSWLFHPSKMRSRAEIPERRYHRFQSLRLLPQELHSAGMRRATWNQWWQTRRKLYEPSGIPARSGSPGSAKLKRKI